MSLILDEHREYLSDPARLSAYERAIRELVRPGHVVLDLAAGTGILGLFACRAGARKVYSVDDGGIIQFARDLSSHNGFGDRHHCIKGFSTRAVLPEKVDVVLSDQIGRFGFNEGIVGYYRDARERFLKSGGITIPSRIDLWVALVEHAELRRDVDFWQQDHAGFNFAPAREIAINTGYPVKLKPDNVLGEPLLLTSMHLESSIGELRGEVEHVVARPGMLHGIGGWFEAQLSPHVTVTNSPFSAEAIRRRNVFFPVQKPVDVAKGDRVRVTMHILPDHKVVTWGIELRGGDGTLRASFSHSTMKGFLLTAEELQRTDPASIPRLNVWGEARLTLLRLCDGRRSLSEIELELLKAHPKLFRGVEEAASFAAEVLVTYAS